MPEQSPEKIHPHPKDTFLQSDAATVGRIGRDGTRIHYAELQVRSNFSFLRGASHPDEYVVRAAELGYEAIALTDDATLAGIVRAHVAARECGIPLVVGARLDLHVADPDLPWTTGVLVHVLDRVGYANLCRLITLGRRRGEGTRAHLDLHDLLAHDEGLFATVLPPEFFDRRAIELIESLRGVFDEDRLSIAVNRLDEGDDDARLTQLVLLSEHLDVPVVATNDVHYHVPERRPLQDVLTCIRHGCSIDEAGRHLFTNAERSLKSLRGMSERFADLPGALERSVEIAERCRGFSLDQLRYRYPSEVVPEGRTPMMHLRALVATGARERYPDGVPERVQLQVEHEFALIEELEYATYFLTVHELVRFARSRGILCQGRGAAANSAVCFCLGVTAVDPARVDVLFERFVSRERDEPPDIDVDFEHERREEVIQEIYRRYGRDRAAICAEVVTYRGRSAIREVGKVMGLSLDLVDRLAKEIDWWHDGVKGGLERVQQLGIDPEDPLIRRTFSLAEELLGFPRHLSQHVGGFVITEGPLIEIVPVRNAAMAERTMIEWDKDDVDAMGMLKVDVLALGMLSCIRKTIELVNDHDLGTGIDGRELALHTIPPEDPATYDMICAADTVGVFQIESRAQMSMLPRLKPRTFYDLVIEVAIVRPGPIQGDMVHPYLRRRNGEEPIEYPDEAVERVLRKTLGVPLFQEQAMSLAIVAAGFTAGEADQLRRAIAAWKRRGNQLAAFGERLIGGMRDRGYSERFAQQVFEQIKGFSGYGFPESHAASFALLVYASAWLKRHHPAAFAAAILNSQPMGFYAPAQLVRDAREHGVEVREVDVNHSAWECTLENVDAPSGPALRLGLRLVRGLNREEALRLAAAVKTFMRAHERPVRSIEELQRVSGASTTTLRRLAHADAFASMSLDRQGASWQAQALHEERLPLFEGMPTPEEEPAVLPEVQPLDVVAQDYVTTGLSLKAHPISFLRAVLASRGVRPCAELGDPSAMPAGAQIGVAGIVLLRQRPSTANGVVFITLEDESGIANLIIRPRVWDRVRRVARHATVLEAHGSVERAGAVVHVMVECLEDCSAALTQVPTRIRSFH